MSNARKLIAVLLSVLIALLAVKTWTVLTREKKPAQAAVNTAAQEKARKSQAPEKNASTKIPKGKRIVTLVVDEHSGITRSLEKGDRVDVIAVTNSPGIHNGKTGRVVLQNVAVFKPVSASSTSLSGKKKGLAKKWDIQLMVTLNEALILSSVDEASTLRLVLRNPEDADITDVQDISFTPEEGIFSQEKGLEDLSRRIAPGMRVISLELDRHDGIFNVLAPGDRVDLIMSSKAARFSTEGGNQAVGAKGQINNIRKSSKTLLQNVEVLGLSRTRKKIGTAGRTMRVSLMVTPSQAEKIAVVTDASKSGLLRIVLRNPEDERQVATRGEIFEDQVVKDKRAFKEIQTIKGTDVYPQKFYED